MPGVVCGLSLGPAHKGFLGKTAEVCQEQCVMLSPIHLFFIPKFSASVPRKLEQKSTYLCGKREMHFWSKGKEKWLLREIVTS